MGVTPRVGPGHSRIALMALDTKIAPLERFCLRHASKLSPPPKPCFILPPIPAGYAVPTQGRAGRIGWGGRFPAGVEIWQPGLQDWCRLRPDPVSKPMP